jgi:UDP-glucose:(heptosyl)LPS alpha-1,3-glucosyltransferase
MSSPAAPPAHSRPTVDGPGGLWRRLVGGVRRLLASERWTRRAGADWPDRIMEQPVTDDFHAKQGRSTGRWVVTDGAAPAVQSSPDRFCVYLKRHYELPWWQGLLATLWPGGAWSPGMRERRNLLAAAKRGLPVPRVVAAGEWIGPWFALQSFLAIEELTGMLPLHKAIPLAKARLGPADFSRWKRTLAAEMARLGRLLHERRWFHKDFYLCHFYVPAEDTYRLPDWHGRVHVIDLHRLKRHRVTWPIWLVKDLGGLLYSTLEVDGVTPRDCLYFWRAYLGTARPRLRQRLLGWSVQQKAGQYRRHNKKKRAALAPTVAAPLPDGTPACGIRQGQAMNIAFCYESVLPARGGCETYIADLARRLIADGHEVHLYACRWDQGALPPEMHFHALPAVRGPRFLRPWRFSKLCLEALRPSRHDVTIGFDKTYGQDVLYPQGGLHAASAMHNRNKFRKGWMRVVAGAVKCLDVAHWSFARLERKQYLGEPRPLIVVNSYMVRDHFQHFLEMSSSRLHVVRSAIDPARFPEHDRFKCRQEWRHAWNIAPTETVALFAAMNYRLKGIEPLLYSVRALLDLPEHRDRRPDFRLVIAGSPHYQAWEKLAAHLRITQHVMFVGHQDPMRHAYFAADFLVHPTFYDPCSLVVLEALACGLPVITTRANGAHELLSPPREGYVLDDPHDHDLFAWSMAQLLDPQRRHACALAARKTAASWTFEQHYQALTDVFAEACRRKHAA